ncbi:MAG: DUF5050 domain-containing protein [Cyanobacteriota bacterium]
MKVKKVSIGILSLAIFACANDKIPTTSPINATIKYSSSSTEVATSLPITKTQPSPTTEDSNFLPPFIQPTITPLPGVLIVETPTPIPTATPIIVYVPTNIAEISPATNPSPTITATPMPSPSPSITVINTPIPTILPTITPTIEPKPSPTITATPIPSPSPSITVINTPIPALTPVPLLVGKLVFSSGTSSTSLDREIYKMNPDGSNIIQITNNNVLDDDPVISPDGNQIVYVSYRKLNGTQGDIYLINSDGSGEKQLTTEAQNSDASWSPDGSKIAFHSTRNGLSQEVFIMNADGSNQTQLTTTPSGKWSGRPSWSPDGSKIAFSTNKDGEISIYTINIDKSKLSKIVGNDAWSPTFSPDGSKIAYYSAVSKNNQFKNQLFLVNSDGSNKIALTPNFEGYLPIWSPDGKYLAFTSTKDGNPEIYLINIESKNLTRLSKNTGLDWYVSWSRK